MQIKFVLAASDVEVISICRELMAELSEIEWQLITSTTPENIRAADLSFCDYTPGVDLPSNVEWGTRVFVLVRRRDLPGFRSLYPQAAGSVILKPITRSILRAILAQALATKVRNTTTENPLVVNLASVRADRDTLLQSLIEANLRLQEYDQERTNFLTRAVHDFRAPLTAINGYCGLLLEEQIGNLTAEQAEVIRRMSQSARRLTRLTNAMFNLSIGRRLDLKPNLHPADIRDPIEQALYEVSQYTDEKRIQITLDLSPCPGVLCIDSSQLEQAFTNLMDNACKFTPRFGSIDVKGYPFFWERRLPNVALEYASERREQQVWAPNSYRIDIRDSGPGVHPDHLEAIFEEYTLYPAGQDRSGGGLGLAVCKMIIDQHDGRIWAENGPNGAVFSVVLPFHNSAAGTRHPAHPAHSEVLQPEGRP